MLSIKQQPVEELLMSGSGQAQSLPPAEFSPRPSPSALLSLHELKTLFCSEQQLCATTPSARTSAALQAAFWERRGHTNLPGKVLYDPADHHVHSGFPPQSRAS